MGERNAKNRQDMPSQSFLLSCCLSAKDKSETLKLFAKVFCNIQFVNCGK